MTDENVKESLQIDTTTTTTNNKFKAELLGKGLFFTLITAVGVISGFGISLGSTKKQNSKLVKNKKNLNYLHASGAELARKALLRATLITVSGFSVFCFSVWKLSGAQDFKEFRYKAGQFLPRISNKKKESEGRRDFENLTELWHYLIDEDQKKKK